MPVVELPCGVQIAPGQVERSLEIKKLSGKVQRDANTEDAKKNHGILIDVLLKPSILKVGTGPVLAQTFNEMLIADRDWLTYDLVRITLGNKVPGNYTCGVCKESMAHEFLIDELPVTRLSDEDTGWWNGERVVKIAEVAPEDVSKLKLRAYALGGADAGYVAVFRYPNGRDQRKVAIVDRIEHHSVELVQELMALTLIQINGKPKPKDGFPIEVWDDIDLDVLTRIQKDWIDAQPGIETMTTVECAKGHVNRINLRAVDFLSQVTPPKN